MALAESRVTTRRSLPVGIFSVAVAIVLITIAVIWFRFGTPTTSIIWIVLAVLEIVIAVLMLRPITFHVTVDEDGVRNEVHAPWAIDRASIANGGVIAANAPVTADMARQIKPIFTEVVAAPAFEEEAVEILSAKKNLRLLVVEPPAREGYEIKQVSGGAVIQERDTYQAGDADPATWRLVAGEAADAAMLADLSFAWRTIRSVRSNAILLARDGATVGVGMGQVNRVDSCRLAVERANTLGLRSTGDAAGGRRKQEDRGSGAERGAVGGAAAGRAMERFHASIAAQASARVIGAQAPTRAPVPTPGGARWTRKGGAGANDCGQARG